MKPQLSYLLRAATAAACMGMAITSYAQQADATAAAPKAKAAGKLDERFAQADANKDGCLTKEEAKEKMPRLYKKFEQIDSEKKSCVSLEQVKTAMQSAEKPKKP
jgi:Ca2+-binding EF-hand superfamily protein